MTYPVLVFEQPAGTFYLAAIPAADVIRMSRANPRTFDPETLTSGGGIQREPSKRRIGAIAQYAGTSDAAFPTAVLLAINGDDCTIENGQLSIRAEKVADIVDGQHRLAGIDAAGLANRFVLPVVVMVDATEEEKALIFATVNGTQTKVPASLIYELFAITRFRSPAKTAHEIARALNSLPDSPWFRRLKMLGRKSVPGSIESLSQGTFVKFLIPNITENPVDDLERIKNNQPPRKYPDCVFNEYFREEKDSVILKILLNTFQGAKRTWPEQWENPSDYVLSKTLGFSGIMRALPEMVRSGKQKSDLSAEYFQAIFEKVKGRMDAEEMTFTTEHFSASASGEAKLRDLILGSLR